MKRNIDLTENLIFSNNRANDMISNLIRANPEFYIMETSFPWNPTFTLIHDDSELDLNHQKISLIPLGSKKEREKIKEYRKMDSENYCDCCGKRMNLIPWNVEYGICRECDEYYQKHDKNNDKIIWRKNSKEFIQNAIIRIS